MLEKTKGERQSSWQRVTCMWPSDFALSWHICKWEQVDQIDTPEKYNLICLLAQ